MSERLVHRPSKQFRSFRFSDMKITLFNDAPIFILYFLKYFGDKYRVRGSIFSRFVNRYRNHPRSIAICPGVKINHFGIIKAPEKLIIISKTRKPTKHPNCLPYFGPYYTSFLAVVSHIPSENTAQVCSATTSTSTPKTVSNRAQAAATILSEFLFFFVFEYIYGFFWGF